MAYVNIVACDLCGLISDHEKNLFQIECRDRSARLESYRDYEIDTLLCTRCALPIKELADKIRSRGNKESLSKTLTAKIISVLPRELFLVQDE